MGNRSAQIPHLNARSIMTPEKIKTYARFARQHARSFLAQRFAETGKPIADAPFRPQPVSWDDESLTVSWLGHATVLINFYGTWFLTDPALRQHVGVQVAGLTIGPRRIVLPALSIKDLPPIDAVLLSHAHMDHSDLGTLKRLPRKAEAVVQHGNADLVRRFRRVHALHWGESVEIKGARIESIKVNHWGARKLTDKHRGYGGFLITKRGRSLVFGGDTAYTNAFAPLASRAQIDLAMLPIGDRFTAGDLMMATVLRILNNTDIVTSDKRLAAYVERCTARPAFKRALDAQIGDFRHAA